jgi:hypothetical protein
MASRLHVRSVIVGLGAIALSLVPSCARVASSSHAGVGPQAGKSSAQRAVASAGEGADPTCVPQTEIGRQYIGPDGQISQTPQEGYATAVQYEGGTEIKTPDGWDPLTASAETLRLFGFPDRPTDPEALAHWQKEFAHYKDTRQLEPSMCKGPEHN